MVIDAHDGHLADGGVAQEDVLDLGGVGVEPAADEHVLDAVGDGEVAARIEHADVAGVEPALVVEGGRGGVGVAVVALHQVVPPGDDLARFALGDLVVVRVDEADLDAGDGPASRLRDDLGGVGVAAHRGDARGLGEAVARHDVLERELGAHAQDHLDGHRGRAGDRQAQRGEVVPVELGVVEDRHVDGGRPGEHRDLLLVDALHHRRHVEDGVGDHRRPAHERRDDAGVEPERVEVRVDHQVAVTLLEADHEGPRVVGPHRGAVAEHGALRVPGGSRGEEDVGHVVGGHRGGAGGGFLRGDRRATREEVAEAHGVTPVGAAQDDDLLERGDLGRVAEQLDVVGVEEVGDRAQQLRLGRLEQVARLAALEPRVDGDHDAAGAVHAERGDDPLADVGCPHPDAITGLDARCDERPGGVIDAIRELGEGEPGIAVDERLDVAELGCGSLDDARDGPGKVLGLLSGAHGENVLR